jgi:hypothetical protein
VNHLGNCIEVSYAVSDRVPDGDNRMHGWTYSYQKNRNERSGPRDKVLGLLRILEDDFEADNSLSATKVHTRVAASDSGAVCPPNSEAL